MVGRLNCNWAQRPNSTRIEPSKPVPWADGRGVQPEHWVFNLVGPDEVIQADYWRGNQSVAVSTVSQWLCRYADEICTKAVGMSIPVDFAR